MVGSDRIIFIFIGISFLFCIPTWFIFAIQDETLHFYIWDMANLCTITLLPVLGYYLILDRAKYGKILLLYFAITLLNPISETLEYFKLGDSWMTSVKITIGCILILYFLGRLRYGR